MPTSRAEWQEYLEDLRTKAQSSTDDMLHAVTTPEGKDRNEREAKINIALYQAASTHYLAMNRQPTE